MRGVSLSAMRILISLPYSHREKYSKLFFNARMVENADISSTDQLIQIVDQFHRENGGNFEEIGVGSIRDILNSDQIKQKLIDNTKFAVSFGVFGVPSFIFLLFYSI